MKKTKVFVVGSSINYANWIPNKEIINKIEDANLVIFTGGEDVSPSIYGEKIGAYTSFNLKRDLEEIEYFEKAKSLGIPMLGICRGSQLLCALSGGRLVQHQENKRYIHSVKTFDNKEFFITSTHHQAMFPYDMPSNAYKLIAWTENLSKFHLDGTNKEISKKPFKEAEIVFYPLTNCLGIQGHPESIWGNKENYTKTFDYLHSLIHNLLNKTF